MNSHSAVNNLAPKGQVILIIIDGFGIGAMDDIEKREGLREPNTALTLFEEVEGLHLPHLTALGLGNTLAPNRWVERSSSAVWGVCQLRHYGADTFWGHQEIMGTLPVKPRIQPFFKILERVKQELLSEGYRVETYGAGRKILIVNDAVTVGDNMETAPGLNHNVVASLDHIAFEEVVTIGKIVRKVSEVSRVIAFGGEGVDRERILSAYISDKELGGVSSSGSGVYEKGYRVIHLGCNVDVEKQVPSLIMKKGVKTALIGKVADIIVNSGGLSLPIIETEECMKKTVELSRSREFGFICTNIQETDLAGHQRNPKLYSEKLSLVDSYIPKLQRELREDDLLIISADHGNDPAVGEGQHTREKTPLLIDYPNKKAALLGTRSTLSDMGASVCHYHNASLPENGTSFLDILK